LFFFFFQAEDGIRDFHVTGVQTCALPILSSVELENAIMAHPKVLEAAVIGVPHPKWQERPIGYVVLRPEFRGEICTDEILAHLSTKFMKWWLPDEIRFVDEVPKTSVGKFDKKVLRQRAMDRS